MSVATIRFRCDNTLFIAIFSAHILPNLTIAVRYLAWRNMGDHDDIEHPPPQGDPSQTQGRERTANTSSPDSLTSGPTPAAKTHNITSVSSAAVPLAVADAAPHPGTVAAVSKVRVPNQVESSQGSFAALNKLLHNFTSGSPKTLKKEAKKASALTDAQVRQSSCKIVG